MNLYELANEYRADVARLQDLDMPPEVVLDTIDSMQGDVSQKIKAVMIVSMELEAESETRAAHAKRMMESAKAIGNRADGLRSYAQIAIQNCGLALPLKYPEFSVNLQKNPVSCEITNAELLPPDMVTHTISISARGNIEKFMAHIKLAIDKSNAGSILNLTVTSNPDKKAVLDALKTVQLVNETKPTGEAKDHFRGAHLNPAAFRVVVK